MVNIAPKRKTWWVGYGRFKRRPDGRDLPTILHFGVVEPGRVASVATPVIEEFEVEEAWRSRIQALGGTPPARTEPASRASDPRPAMVNKAPASYDTLHEATKDLHHACEQHALGQRMVKGAVSPEEWADWLWAMRVLHSVADIAVPDHMARDRSLSADLDMLPKAKPSRAALSFAASMVGQECGGMAYVLHGAHRSGGRVLAPKMAKRGLPTAHTSYRFPETVTMLVSQMRGCTEWADTSRATFHCLLSVMDEIVSRY